MSIEIRLYIAVAIITLLALSVTGFIVYFIILYRRRQKEAEEEKRELQARFQGEIVKTQLEISEQTMKSISQEIHDNVGQTLSLAKLNIGALMEASDDPRLASGAELISRALQDLRELSRSLNGNYVIDVGIVDAIRRELDLVETSGGVKCWFDADQFPQLTAQESLIVFRCLQESLANAVRHGKPRNIFVSITADGERFCVGVRDDGEGMDASQIREGIGLRSIRERMIMIGGEARLVSSPGKGTRVVLLRNMECQSSHAP